MLAVQDRRAGPAGPQWVAAGGGWGVGGGGVGWGGAQRACWLRWRWQRGAQQTATGAMPWPATAWAQCQGAACCSRRAKVALVAQAAGELQSCSGSETAVQMWEAEGVQGKAAEEGLGWRGQVCMQPGMQTGRAEVLATARGKTARWRQAGQVCKGGQNAGRRRQPGTSARRPTGWARRLRWTTGLPLPLPHDVAGSRGGGGRGPLRVWRAAGRRRLTPPRRRRRRACQLAPRRRTAR